MREAILDAVGDVAVTVAGLFIGLALSMGSCEVRRCGGTQAQVTSASSR